MLWTILLSGTILLILSFSFFAIMGEREQKKIAQQTEFLLREIDHKYENFIHKRLDLAVLKQEDADAIINDMSKKAFVILKPEIDGIMAFINATQYSNISVQPNSKYFKGPASLASAYFRKTSKSKTASLNLQDEAKFREAFIDSIKSDLTQRHLDLKAGNYLD